VRWQNLWHASYVLVQRCPFILLLALCDSLFKDCVIESEALVGCRLPSSLLSFPTSRKPASFSSYPDNEFSVARQLFHHDGASAVRFRKERHKIQRFSCSPVRSARAFPLIVHISAPGSINDPSLSAGYPASRSQARKDFFGDRQSRANERLPGENVSRADARAVIVAASSRLPWPISSSKRAPHRSAMFENPIHNTPEELMNLFRSATDDLAIAKFDACSASVPPTPKDFLWRPAPERLIQVSFPST